MHEPSDHVNGLMCFKKSVVRRPGQHILLFYLSATFCWVKNGLGFVFYVLYMCFVSFNSCPEKNPALFIGLRISVTEKHKSVGACKNISKSVPSKNWRLVKEAAISWDWRDCAISSSNLPGASPVTALWESGNEKATLMTSGAIVCQTACGRLWCQLEEASVVWWD